MQASSQNPATTLNQRASARLIAAGCVAGAIAGFLGPRLTRMGALSAFEIWIDVITLLICSRTMLTFLAVTFGAAEYRKLDLFGRLYFPLGCIAAIVVGHWAAETYKEEEPKVVNNEIVQELTNLRNLTYINYTEVGVPELEHMRTLINTTDGQYSLRGRHVIAPSARPFVGTWDGHQYICFNPELPIVSACTRLQDGTRNEATST